MPSPTFTTLPIRDVRTATSPADDCDLDLILALAAKGSRRAFAAGADLFCQGDRPDGLYLVESGTVALSLAADDGQETFAALVGAGELLGEAGLVDGAAREKSAVALEAVQARFVRRETFLLAAADDPRIVWAIARVLAERLRGAHGVIGDLVFMDARRRLARRLLALAKTHGRPAVDGSIEIRLRLTQVELAALIGTGRESVNKAFRELRQSGAVATANGFITIHDHAALARATGRER